MLQAISIGHWLARWIRIRAPSPLPAGENLWHHRPVSLAPIHLAGTRFLLDPAGALLCPEAGLLAVADLHLEKGSACAHRGQLVPPYDSHVTLDRLAALLRRHQPKTLLAVGDSFHDNAAPARLSRADAARLHALTQQTRFVWIGGNHDPAPASLPGDIVPEYRLGPIVFRHQSEATREPEISGHYHPKARVATRAGTIARPCFVADHQRVLLPAFGAYTGGLDVQNPAIARLFPRGGRAFLLGRDRLFSFGLTELRSG